LLSALAWIGGDLSASFSLPLALVILALGVPHGAADHLLFLAHRPARQRDGKKLLPFFIYYLVFLVGYGGLWLVMPAVAFMLFLLVSIFHFGEARLENSGSSPGQGWQLTLAWGCFVLLFPVLHHFAEARPIIEGMIGIGLPDGEDWTVLICVGLVLANVLVITGRTEAKGSWQARQLLDLVLLTLMYLGTDLMLGFALFFFLWHSLPAGMAQWRFLRDRRLLGDLTDYFRRLLPLSGGAVILFLLFYLYLRNLEGAKLDLSSLFVFVSLISLPHAILMHAVYRPTAR
jgi:Brp/Blh family beta-carotene 15,15'-monooxygenase